MVVGEKNENGKKIKKKSCLAAGFFFFVALLENSKPLALWRRQIFNIKDYQFSHKYPLEASLSMILTTSRDQNIFRI